MDSEDITELSRRADSLLEIEIKLRLMEYLVIYKDDSQLSKEQSMDISETIYCLIDEVIQLSSLFD
ncbi:hypothetical protein SAMN04487944_1316 [Gracilibacillus ureilyticus]|uniref:Uncharacterized protein n=1 Tax=Gracilibacillus ureilyticus TaxID=531814 RepID=A0A1H9VZV0_9BACI|nr:hypothetical protein [Gracilibacillus ureilyticus]SES27172.1 hypothetical protein SAMN04487944_1316 [Gracilibacillus ureilyticus]